MLNAKCFEAIRMDNHYDSVKSRGRDRANPDSKRNWNLSRDKGRHSGRWRKREKRKNNSRARVAQSQTEDVHRKQPKRLNQQRYDHGYVINTLKYRRARRSAEYCQLCGDRLCGHRVKESAVLVLMSQRFRSGAFGVLPREIAEIIAKQVLALQAQHLKSLVEIPNAGDVLWHY